MTINIFEFESVCENCIHFYQHYVENSIDPSGYLACNSGHCVFPRVKSRKPGEQSCKHFKNRNELKEKER